MKIVIEPGAQTKRQDDAGPVSAFGLAARTHRPPFLHSRRCQAAAAISVKRRRWYATCSNRSTFLQGAEAMAITVEAIYENGVLKPAEPLPFKEGEKVRVTVQTPANWVEATAGLLGWTGSSEELGYFALDPELDPQESA
jgi:predicted DNA-binding antitoxin AbrB/MazE fold protein